MDTSEREAELDAEGVKHGHEERADPRPQASRRRTLNKPGRERSDGFVADSVRRSAQATSSFIGGSADAIGRGLRAYGDSLNNDNIFRMSVDNGFTIGMLRAYEEFYARLSLASREALENISGAQELGTDDPAPGRELSVNSIDLDDLASRIAAKLEERSVRNPDAAARTRGRST